MIAEYWADGPNSELPPGHWTMFASYVVTRDGLTFDSTVVKLFFAVTSAIADAAIATWEAAFLRLRATDHRHPPSVQGARPSGRGRPGKGVVEMDGAAWRPFQVPTFRHHHSPEYTGAQCQHGSGRSAATIHGKRPVRWFLRAAGATEG